MGTHVLVPISTHPSAQCPLYSAQCLRIYVLRYHGPVLHQSTLQWSILHQSTADADSMKIKNYEPILITLFFSFLP
jgi:hypothetical protein